MSFRLRKRHRLRKKEIRSLIADLEEVFSITCFSADDTIDQAMVNEIEVILLDNEILGLIIDKKPFLSVKGILKYCPQNRYVTVDMGAVKFVYNGADVMAPGIIDSDSRIKEGDLVWVRDEKNLKPLAVGVAITSGPEMVQSNSGKSVKTIHHVGDDFWNYEN
jgi:PUA domain protein